ncbi:DUF2752 domain-containing protein [Mesoterricola sediminis]|uniref:DUF2752 domain-containing protein n=1 Tax=Mesoterricola sediminis TaxID=2927980 RepID=A0AA48GWE6_9BACT|nr:DUF2752 domain-containing protein [Mesoterricola sediminis]BDU76900.1 hypothetical protein METESE_18580 [Mesoterricola sediminis]
MPADAPSRSDRALFLGLTLAGLAAVAAPDLVLAAAPPCLVTLVTGHPCWGCGLTHALTAAAGLEWGKAWAFNPRVALVGPLLLWEYARLGRRVWAGRRPAP